jgi:hypothetical protein
MEFLALGKKRVFKTTIIVHKNVDESLWPNDDLVINIYSDFCKRFKVKVPILENCDNDVETETTEAFQIKDYASFGSF